MYYTYSIYDLYLFERCLTSMIIQSLQIKGYGDELLQFFADDGKWLGGGGVLLAVIRYYSLNHRANTNQTFFKNVDFYVFRSGHLEVKRMNLEW
jgi:hypothetical protein